MAKILKREGANLEESSVISEDGTNVTINPPGFVNTTNLDARSSSYPPLRGVRTTASGGAPAALSARNEMLSGSAGDGDGVILDFNVHDGTNHELGKFIFRFDANTQNSYADTQLYSGGVLFSALSVRHDSVKLGVDLDLDDNDITGGFTAATASDRPHFVSSTANGFTAVGIKPNGTSTDTYFTLTNDSDVDNASAFSMTSNASYHSILTSKTGTGTTLPISFYAETTELLKINTDKSVEFKGDIIGAFGSGTVIRTDQANSLTSAQVAPTGTATSSYFSVTNASDVSNAAIFAMASVPGYNAILNTQAGTGSIQEMRITMGGAAYWTFETDGTFSVAPTLNYETLVTDDDDIPNKKYVDDAVSGVSATDPAGADEQIQFNNSGVFGANSNFIWRNGVQRLRVGGSSTGIQVTTTGIIGVAGGDIEMVSGNIGAVPTKAYVKLVNNSTATLHAAGSSVGTGNNAIIEGGSAGGTGKGGDVNLDSGDGSTSGAGGNVNISAGAGGTTGDGGDVILTTGGTTAGATGDIEFKQGSGTAAVNVRYYEGNAGGEYVALKAPDAVTTSRIWVLPVDDPSVADGNFLTTNSSGVLSFASAGIANLEADTDPTLGANLDTNYKQIVGDNITLKGNAGSPGGQVLMQGGNGTTGGTGGRVQVIGGTGGTTGAGGQVDIRTGTSGTGSPGKMFVAGGQNKSSTPSAETITIEGNNLSNAPSNTGTTGNAVLIRGGFGNATGAGGKLELRGGEGGATSGAGGDVTIASGATTNGNAGNITIDAEDGGTSGNNGGSITIDAGNGNGSGTGGDINIQVGGGGASGSAGNIHLRTNDGASNQGAVIIRGLGNQARLQLRETPTNGTNHIELKAPASIGSNASWLLPEHQQSSGDYLGIDLGEYTIANLPSASTYKSCWALATDASGGRTVVRSDGTNWKVVAVEGATVA